MAEEDKTKRNIINRKIVKNTIKEEGMSLQNKNKLRKRKTNNSNNNSSRTDRCIGKQLKRKKVRNKKEDKIRGIEVIRMLNNNSSKRRKDKKVRVLTNSLL